jgi:predicted nuclease with TOPRIM domain
MYNQEFYNRAKELAGKEWNTITQLEKVDYMDKLKEEGLYPTAIVKTGFAHLCEVKSVREEIEQIKIDNKKLREDIDSLQKRVKELEES